jgi:hypothetical protein
MSPSNAFGFPVEHVPPQEKKPAETVGHFSATVTPPALPEPAPDLVAAGDKAREQAGQRLKELVWEYPDGTRRVPLLTSSRWAFHEALRGRIGADDTALVMNPQQAHAAEHSRRFLDGTLLLFLCLNPTSTWEEPRTRMIGARTIEIEPMVSDFYGFLAAWRRWVDESIPLNRLDDAVILAETLVSLTFSALAVRVNEATEEDAEESAEKKTQSPAGKTDTSPQSALP